MTAQNQSCEKQLSEGERMQTWTTVCVLEDKTGRYGNRYLSPSAIMPLVLSLAVLLLCHIAQCSDKRSLLCIEIIGSLPISTCMHVCMCAE